MISPSTNAEGMLQFNEAIAEVDEEGLEHKKIARPVSNYTAANYKIRQSKKGHKLVIDNANYQTNNPRIESASDKRSLKRPVSAVYLLGKNMKSNHQHH